MNNELHKYSDLYRTELFDNIVPFWMEHSPDHDFGGYLTCLDRFGNVYDTDKFTWLQSRQVWFFSMLYNQVEKKKEWLDMALLGAEFLMKHGRDASGNWYFSFTRDGQPLIQPHCIFADCFTAMGFGELFKATEDPEHRKIAADTFANILRKADNPKGIYNKRYPGTRPLKNFAFPMILCNLANVLGNIIDPAKTEELSDSVIKTLLVDFVDEETGLMRENINPDGSFNDSFEGRNLLPGHAIEGMWFVMDLAAQRHDGESVHKAVEIALRMLDYAWDTEEKYNGGILYYFDIKGAPLIQLQWDRKLWWLHIETLVTLAKGYVMTGNQDCKRWFEKVHDYTWKHFRDPEAREWFGYLDRYGEPFLSLKGSMWKGCYHIPRGLYQVYRTLEGETLTVPFQNDADHQELRQHQIVR